MTVMIVDNVRRDVEQNSMFAAGRKLLLASAVGLDPPEQPAANQIKHSGSAGCGGSLTAKPGEIRMSHTLYFLRVEGFQPSFLLLAIHHVVFLFRALRLSFHSSHSSHLRSI